ncbi:MAG: YlxM family DNA-binding protein [Lachnospiraceae bacterium]|nr:YlxM family DNA-binding protein [Lachnospiraceae bacterium]
MESFVEKSYLYDFYGELLTEHQRQVYEQIMFEDLSASEVAREAGISRQGVHDMIRRCERILEDYESKLHLVEKFLHIRDNVQKIQGYTDQILEEHPLEEVERIKSIASDILEEL